MTVKITPGELRALILGRDELALLDVREAGEFGLGHLLTATNLPLTVLEASISGLVPRLTTPVVLIDGSDDDRAAYAARRLAALGYGRVKILAGGTAAWRSAGYALFEGVNVPTKAFAEEVLEHSGTPEITAPELKSLIASGRPFTLVDGRTESEHKVRCIPGSISLPNGELLLHIADVAPNEADPIIVHCAGRTRSIIGAQTLIAAGVSNPVFALRGGTQEWSLNEFELERGSTRKAPALTETARTQATALAGQLAASGGGFAIDRNRFHAWRTEAERTLYLIDVRTKEEYEAGHFPGAVHAPGGQLVHAIDLWVGTRGARIALLDTAPYARANMAAYWLLQQGWEVGVPDFLTEAEFAETGQHKSPAVPYAARISIDDLARPEGTSALVIDVGSSTDYRRHHLPGARWLIRPKVLEAVNSGRFAQPTGLVVLYGDDSFDLRPDLVAKDLQDLAPDIQVQVLDGGRAAWLAAGQKTDASPDHPADAEAIDVLFWLHDRHTGNLTSARTYLDWELELVERLGTDGTIRFRVGNEPWP